MHKPLPIYTLSPDNKHVVLRDGEEFIHLNERLVISQGVSDASLLLIREAHIEKNKVYDRMERTDDKEWLIQLAEEVKNIEFKLQELWGFSLDENFHDWFMVPKCQCPKLDNMERKGSNYQIRTLSCPIHGQ